MDYTRVIYSWGDMEPVEAESAPSIGIPALETVGFARAKNGTPYFIYIAELKNSYKDKCEFQSNF